MAVSAPLLGGTQKGRFTTFAGLAGVGALALVCTVALAFSAGSQRVALDEINVNCDGSVDVTTTSLVPCAGGVLPATTVYTSYAPAYFQPPPMVPAVPAAAPAGYPNAFQYPTVWSGDHVLSGGQLEWAAEDAAQHALNLDNWRIKILESKRRQAELQNEIREASAGAGLGGSPMRLSQTEGQSELSSVKRQIATLARGTAEAVDAVQKEVKLRNSKIGSLKKLEESTDKELSGIMKELDQLSDEDYN